MLDLKSNNCVLKCIDFEKLDKNIEGVAFWCKVYFLHFQRIFHRIIRFRKKETLKEWIFALEATFTIHPYYYAHCVLLTARMQSFHYSSQDVFGYYL